MMSSKSECARDGAVTHAVSQQFVLHNLNVNVGPPRKIQRRSFYAVLPYTCVHSRIQACSRM